MLDASGAPHTAHSTNPVPLVLIEEGREDAVLEEGILGDIATTVIGLWGMEPPAGMTGKNLVHKG
jgi:2,3-bisphosphoglycerate-independent phosphoglycerate mutase